MGSNLKNLHKKRTHICDVYLKTDIPKYPPQLLKLSPKSHFSFSDFLCQGEGGAFYDCMYTEIKQIQPQKFMQSKLQSDYTAFNN